MKAKEARKLIVGDWVFASFAGYRKAAQIVVIDWPHFTIKAKGSKGELIREARYTSLIEKLDTPSPRTPPDWLQWPTKQETV